MFCPAMAGEGKRYPNARNVVLYPNAGRPCCVLFYAEVGARLIQFHVGGAKVGALVT